MKALIIGGGIGGLCAGIALQQAGHEVTVFEQTAELRPVGAGLSIWVNALNALRELGIYAAFRSVSAVGAESGIRTAQGTALTATASEQLCARLGTDELMRIVHRADLHQLLLAQLGDAQLQTGAACIGFQEEDGQITAHFVDGSSATGDYLIGADGIHSAIRAQLHGEIAPTYSGYTAWRAVVGVDPNALLPGESWGRGARFGQLPLNNGRVYWFATHNEPEGAQATEGEKTRLQQLFGDWHDPIPDLITATPADAILRHDIYDRPPLTTWGKGRVTLLGDAAHPMTPNLGQGACQAIEDAVVLGRMVRRASTITQALRVYEAARIPRTTTLVNQSRTIGRMGQWQNPLLVHLRSLLMRGMPAQLQLNQLTRTLTFPTTAL